MVLIHIMGQLRITIVISMFRIAMEPFISIVLNGQVIITIIIYSLILLIIIFLKNYLAHQDTVSPAFIKKPTLAEALLVRILKVTIPQQIQVFPQILDCLLVGLLFSLVLLMDQDTPHTCIEVIMLWTVLVL